MEWLKNSEYWKLRFEQLEQAQNGQGAAAFAEIEKQYKEAQKQIEGQIARWYQRFADNNGITLAQARQYLKGAALKEFQWDVQDYIKYGQDNALMGGWMKELENTSAKYHISKLEALKIQTQQSLEVMFSKQMGTVTGAMGDIFESGYYHTAYELQKGFNIGWDIAGLNQSQIEKVLSKPWAVDGKNFSERIWTNKEKLISELHGELTQNIMGYLNQNMRNIEIFDLKMENFQSDNCYHIDVNFENNSSFPVVQLCVHAGAKNNINCILWGIEAMKKIAIYIPPHGTQAIRFIVPCEMFEAENKYQLPLHIEFINIFDFRTVGTIYLHNLENTERRNEFQFRLAKFTDVRSK